MLVLLSGEILHAGVWAAYLGGPDWDQGWNKSVCICGGDPISLGDPSGLFGAADLPTIPCGVANFLTGVADSASFGIGPYIRGLYGIDGGIDTTSGAYTAGEVASLGLGLGRLGYASIAAGIRNVPGITGIAANVMRNDLKLAFRGGLFPNARMPALESFAGKTEEQIIQSASRTNAGVNGAGVNGALGAPVNAVANAARGGGGAGSCP